MSSPSNSTDDLVDRIIRAWTEFAAHDEAMKVGKTLRELLELASAFCQDHKWTSAQKSCEYGSEILKMDSEHEKSINLLMGEGALNFLLATTYVGMDRIDLALDYFEESRKLFGATIAYVPSAAVWFCMGEIYISRADWAKAMWAFQRSLSALEAHISKSHATTDQLKKTAQSGFVRAKAGLEKTIRTPASFKRTSRVQMTSDVGKPDVRNIPIVREIAAGTPKSTIDEVLEANLTDDNIIDVISIDSSHLAGAELGFRVNGKSMIEGGIRDGDYALIRLAQVASNGEIVVAVIGSEGTETAPTLKKYYHVDDPRFPHHRLQPMNSAEPQIIVIPPGVDPKGVESQYEGTLITTQTGEVEIKGKLVAIWRKA